MAGIDGKETRERRFCWLVPCVIFLCSSRAPTPSSSSESGHLRPCAQVGVEVEGIKQGLHEREQAADLIRWLLNPIAVRCHASYFDFRGGDEERRSAMFAESTSKQVMHRVYEGAAERQA